MHWLMLRPQGKGMAPAYGYSVLKRRLHPWEFRYVLQKVVRMQLKQRIVQQMS